MLSSKKYFIRTPVFGKPNLLFSVYLISTAIANQSKAQFYDINLPRLEDVRDLISLSTLTYFSLAIPCVRPRTAQIFCSSEQTFLEKLQHRLVERFAKILRHTQVLQLTHLDVLKTRINGVETALERVDPAKDQSIFIEHNIRPFTLPNDWVFEPCATFYDTVRQSHLFDESLTDISTRAE